MDIIYGVILLLATVVSAARQQREISQSYGAWKSRWDPVTMTYVISVLPSPVNFLANHAETLIFLSEELKASACVELRLIFVIPTDGGDYLEANEMRPTGTCNPTVFGKQNNGRNEMIFGAPCSRARVKQIFLAHLGMRFTHQRSDRDQYVLIVPPNSDLLVIDNSILPAHSITPYDFKSIMSYPTIQVSRIYKLGQSVYLDLVPRNLVLSRADGVILQDLYYNAQCQVENPCSVLNPCQNGGSCFDQKYKEPYCGCTTYYEGINCTERIVQCKANTCENGGQCMEGSGNMCFKCICAGTYGGKRCQYDLLDEGWFCPGNGYQYHLTSTPGNWFEANRDCKILHAELAHDGIRDPPTFHTLVMNFTTGEIWIGAAAQYVSSYYWNDNIETSGTLTPWGWGQPERGDTKHCAAIKDMMNKWHSTQRALANMNCNSLLYGLCEKPIGNPLTHGAHRPGNGMIYFKTPAPTNFRIAREQCQERGGHLIVYGAATSSQLKNIVDCVFGTSKYNIFVGFEDFGSSRIFKAIVGYEILSYHDERWAPGEPNWYNDYHNAVKTTVELNGKLRDVHGQYEAGYGLCEAKDIPVSECSRCADGNCLMNDALGIEICTCLQGYVKDLNGNCIDINECQAFDDDLCEFTECINLPGSYACVPYVLNIK